MKNKVVVITGASSGIGKSLAIECARRGAKLVLGARSQEKLEGLRKQLHEAEILVIQTDVSIEADCEHLIQAAVAKYGTIDILINNAGQSMRGLFKDTDLMVIRQLMDVNFYGAVYCTKFALPYLLKSKGSLVGVSSIAGHKGLPGRAGYSASKFALQGFLEVLRIENMKNGLHVLIACPGFTASNIRHSALGPDGRIQGESPRDEKAMMSPEAVAKSIVNAIHKRKQRLILTREGKLTVLINKFLPKLMDRIVYNHMAKEVNSPFK